MQDRDGVDLGVLEAARIVRRTPETVRRWIWSGKLPAHKEGNRLVVARADLIRVSAASTSAAPTGAHPLDLASWRRTVAEQRAAGALGTSSAGASAADLVLADRAARETP